MAAAKTRASDADVDAHLAARAASPEQLADGRALVALLSKASGEPPRLWGPSIVGFGSYRYPLAGGKTGEACAAGFALRGRELVVYLMAEDARQAERLQRLGPHRLGKSCLYLRRLADVDVGVLEALVASSLDAVRRRYPDGAG